MPQRLVVVDHPVLADRLTVMRDRDTGHGEFRQALFEASAILAVEAARELPVAKVEIETPLEPTTGSRLPSEITIVPVLRAGLGMVDGFLRLLPDARVGHVGVYRDEEQHRPVDYYERLPPGLADSHVFVVDPMLATGGSAVHALDRLKARAPGSSRWSAWWWRRRGWRRWSSTTPTCPSGPPPWTASSTRTPTSAPAWATPATACSAPPKHATVDLVGLGPTKSTLGSRDARSGDRMGAQPDARRPSGAAKRSSTATPATHTICAAHLHDRERAAQRARHLAVGEQVLQRLRAAQADGTHPVALAPGAHGGRGADRRGGHGHLPRRRDRGLHLPVAEAHAARHGQLDRVGQRRLPARV